MLSTRKNLFVFLLLIFGIILHLFLFSVFQDKNSLAQDIIQNCKQENISGHLHECLRKNILKKVSSDPQSTHILFDDFWQLSVQQKLSTDPRLFVDLAHEAGMILAHHETTLSEKFLWCGESFKQGCMHGVIMEYIDHQSSQIDTTEFNSICDIFIQPLEKSNCIHGVGHELIAKIKDDLPSILSLCKDMYPETDQQWACASGVLMEFSKGETGKGVHSHQPVGSVELPCLTLPEEYKQVCFASAGSYRQYYPNQEHFSETYTYCASVPREYVADCMRGVSERLLISTGGNSDHASKYCAELNNENTKQSCYTSIQEMTRAVK